MVHRWLTPRPMLYSETGLGQPAPVRMKTRQLDTIEQGPVRNEALESPPGGGAGDT